jgi:hypothetical protein
MMKLFKRGSGSGEGHIPERTRPSRGWADVLAYLRTDPSASLRVLDFGTTSPGNINLLTSLGHSVYMANIVGEAQKPEWQKTPDAGGPASKSPEYDAERFAAANLDFSGRDFDIVLLWDTADYLPVPLVPVLFQRIRAVTRPQGRLLAFFHNKADGPNTGYARYQLTEGPDLRIVGNEPLPVRQVLQNRQVERYLEGFSAVRFFQGTDNVREVLATF